MNQYIFHCLYTDDVKLHLIHAMNIEMAEYNFRTFFKDSGVLRYDIYELPEKPVVFRRDFVEI